MTAASACTPVSWLRLERYALGELSAGERTDIAGHLATCGRCRACADDIAADGRRALPPLPAPRPPATRRRWSWRLPSMSLRFGLAAGLAVTAAAWALRPGERAGLGHPRMVAIKGGDVAVELVRESHGSIAWEPTSFGSGDRIKVLVTCAAPLKVHADILILQSDGPTFVGVAAPIACGNRVPVPPAFRITGPGDAQICVLLDPSGPPSRALLPDGAPAASVAHACVALSRAD